MVFSNPFRRQGVSTRRTRGGAVSTTRGGGSAASVSPADDNSGGNNDARAAQLLPAVQADAPPSPLRNDGAAAAAAAAVAALEEDAPSPQRNNDDDDASAGSINPFGPDPEWVVQQLRVHAAAAAAADPEGAAVPNADDNRAAARARVAAADRAAAAAAARARAAANANAAAQNAMAFLGLGNDGGANDANYNVFHANDNGRAEENNIRPFEDNCPITHSPAERPVGLCTDHHAFDLESLRSYFNHNLGFHAIQNADGTEGEAVFSVLHPMTRAIIPQSQIESSIIPITGERAELIRAERVRLGME